MSDLKALRAEMHAKYQAKLLAEEKDQAETRAKEEKRLAKEKERLAKEKEKREEEERKKKERLDHQRHERLHVEIAAVCETFEEANLLLMTHQEEFEKPLMAFNEGSFSYYKRTSTQEKYGIVRPVDKVQTEALLGPGGYMPMTGGPMATGPMAAGQMATGPMATGPIHEDDPLLQLAIQASLE